MSLVSATRPKRTLFRDVHRDHIPGIVNVRCSNGCIQHRGEIGFVLFVCFSPVTAITHEPLQLLLA